MDAIMSVLMFTAGVGIHVVLWALVLDWINRDQPKFNWQAFIAGFIMMCIGSFLILTSLIAVIRVALISAGVVQ